MGKLSHIVKAIDTARKRKIEAYHGSQEDFDKFSTEKIGTGMGGDESFDGAGLFFNEKKNFVEKNFAEDGVVYKTELDIDPETEMLNQQKTLKTHPNHKQILEMLNSVDADVDWGKLKGNEVVSELYNATDDWSEVRKRLSSVGIKGAKYKQERTSLGGAGTQNYVIFDDSLITIAEKNGIVFKQVEDLAKSKGITKQQALSMIMGVGAIGAGMQSQDAEAGVIGTGSKVVKIKDLITSPDGVATANSNKMWSKGRKHKFDDTPVDVVETPSGTYLLNGYHRRMNALDAGKEDINVKVHPLDDNMRERLSKEMPNLLKQEGITTPEGMAGTAVVGTAGMGLQAFLAKRKQRANSLVNRIGYVAEPLATIATGYGADLAGGLAGVASLPFGADTAAKNVETVQNAMPSYMPQTEGGNQAFEDLGGLIDEGANMYNFTADKTGFDPVANFEQTAEWLHQKKLDALAAILKGLPEIL